MGVTVEEKVGGENLRFRGGEVESSPDLYA